MHGFRYLSISKRYFMLSLLLGAMLQCSHAQAKVEEIELKLEFKVFSLDRKSIDGLFYEIEPGEIAPLKFSARQRSEPHRYRGSQVVSFYTRNSSTTADAPPYIIAGSVQIAPEMKEPLIFFLPLQSSNPDESNGFRIIAMDDSPESFPYGYVRVLNASGAPLSGQVGNQGIRLGFEVSPAWSSRSLFSREGQWVNLALFIQIREDYEVVYANQLTFETEARSILVVRPPRRKNSLRVVTYILEDFPEPDKSSQLTQGEVPRNR